MFLAVIDDQQAQQSGSGFFANAQNPVITGGSFTIVSLIVVLSVILVLILCTEQHQYSPC